jgi:NFACT protein RNA binding domain
LVQRKPPRPPPTCSENYLVLSGRDAQKNELLVKRYLGKGDAYVHGDLNGSPSTIVKNHDPERAIPALTLSQACAPAHPVATPDCAGLDAPFGHWRSLALAVAEHYWNEDPVNGCRIGTNCPILHDK